MKLKSILLFALCTTLFTCSSDSEDTTDVTEEPTNDNTLLKKTIETHSDGEINVINYSYDGNRLIKVAYDDYFKSMYTYNNDYLTQVDYFSDNDLESTVKITYNTENQVASYVEYLYNVSDTKIANRTVLTYNSDSSITLDSYSGDFESQTEVSSTNDIINYNANLTSITYENQSLSYLYDNQNSSFKNVFAIDVLNLLSLTTEFADEIYGKANNVTEIKNNVGNKNLAVETFEYNYNVNNYPVTAKYKDSFNGKLNYQSTLQYFYE